MQDTADYGNEPYVVDIEDLTEENELFRVTKWTGRHLQMTVMSIQPGDEIGLEVHNDHDQFLCIQAGCGKVVMSQKKDDTPQEWEVADDWAALVPAGTWHNVVNTGDTPLKLYSIYAPTEHPRGTVQHSKNETATAA